MKLICLYRWKKVALVWISFLLCTLTAASQPGSVKNSFFLNILPAGKDSAFNPQEARLQTSFNSQVAAETYVSRIPSLLGARGFPLASVDSSWQSGDTLHILLFPGPRYQWMELRHSGIEPEALVAAGFMTKAFDQKSLDISQVLLLQQRLLNFYEKRGYPFAAVYIDSISVQDEKIGGILKADKGVLYHIDSIRVFGKARLNKKFLARYLDIPNRSPYNKEKLARVDKRILELPYLTTLQGSDLTMLGSGAVLNVYVAPRKSSQVNFLVGFLPSANETGKLLVTGDVNLDLKNMLGSGEGFLLKWQQLQPKSPRLNLGYDQPYLFNSPFGLNLLFDLFKKDSNFVQVNAQGGLQFDVANNQTGRIFLQWQSTGLLAGAVDTNQVKFEKRLPPNIDVKAVNVGLNYDLQGTNYRFNPRSGNELSLVSIVGIKNIQQNTDILSIKDPSFNYAGLYDSVKQKSYQLRIKLSGAHYFPVGKNATVRAGMQGGFYSSPSIFRNELFQIGGYKLLRGFDEESIYATRYAVFTAEYRYLLGLNSYLFGFTDAGWASNKYQSVHANNKFLGGGIGLLFERKAGLINMSFAIGKRDDVPFNLRQAAKIHFGYINYF